MRRLGTQFVYRVEHGQNSVKKWSAARHRSLPCTPRHHEWTIGEEVVYVQYTAAGWMPTTMAGTIIDFIKRGRQRQAIVLWQGDVGLSPTISFQRLRPLPLIHDFLQTIHKSS